MHELQTRFATLEGEESWEGELRARFEAGDLDGANAILQPALEGLDSDFGRLALAARGEDLLLSGWEELVETIRTHEGEAITGVAMAVANEADRAFEKGSTHRPYMMLGLYCDEPFAFSKASSADLIGQTRAEDGPAWAGYDEDIEVYLDIEGLDQLNTALIHHKQRHFFRDDRPDHAPLRYVEYVLGCWWRALLFHQAVAEQANGQPLPRGIPIVTGMVDMRPEVLMVHGKAAAPVVEAPVRRDIKPVAPILAADFIQVKTVEEVKEVTGSDLRKRVAETGQEDEPVKRPGFLARLFGRRASR